MAVPVLSQFEDMLNRALVFMVKLYVLVVSVMTTIILAVNAGYSVYVHILKGDLIEFIKITLSNNEGMVLCFCLLITMFWCITTPTSSLRLV
jgi:hypothetical protein